MGVQEIPLEFPGKFPLGNFQKIPVEFSGSQKIAKSDFLGIFAPGAKIKAKFGLSGVKSGPENSLCEFSGENLQILFANFC